MYTLYIYKHNTDEFLFGQYRISICLDFRWHVTTKTDLSSAQLPLSIKHKKIYTSYSQEVMDVLVYKKETKTFQASINKWFCICQYS